MSGHGKLTGRSRLVIIVSVLLVSLAVVMGAARLWTYITDRSATDRRLTTIAQQNRQLLEAVLSVTGPEAQARSAAGTRDILLRNAIETDCRSRRQQVRLAAPDPARPCAEQTPPSVYPGVDGTPTKGP